MLYSETCVFFKIRIKKYFYPDHITKSTVLGKTKFFFKVKFCLIQAGNKTQFKLLLILQARISNKKSFITTEDSCTVILGHYLDLRLYPGYKGKVLLNVKQVTRDNKEASYIVKCYSRFNKGWPIAR